MIIGKLPGCVAKPPTPGWPIKDLVLEATAGTSYPIVMNFPAGHIPGKRTLLMGVPSEIDTGRRRLTIVAAP
jgi:muramoyltetrapeptide carboxypeptidase LdcA involved in peptidoglycan recycling